MLELYLRSRGEGVDYDFTVVKVTPEEKEFDPIYQHRFDVLQSFVDPNEFNVVLFRKDAYLILQVGRLKSSKRLDYRKRIVRDSIILIDADTPETERNFRGIIIEALNNQDKLCGLLDRYVQFATNEAGFTVDYQLLKDLQSFNATGNAELPPELQRPNVIGMEDPQQYWQELAKVLAKYRLPRMSGPLVVVAIHKEAATLRNYGVWRGITSIDTGMVTAEEKKSNRLPYGIGIGCLVTGLLCLLIAWILLR